MFIKKMFAEILFFNLVNVCSTALIIGVNYKYII
jgi:hypothetical protein